MDRLGLMWDAEEDSECDTNDFNHNNVDQLMFRPDEKKNLDFTYFSRVDDD